MKKNINLTIFVVLGFILTTALWGFVGGCGTTNKTVKNTTAEAVPETGKEQVIVPAEKTSVETAVSADSSAEGMIIEGENPIGTTKVEGVAAGQSREENICHVVKSGDTLWSISKKYGVGVDAIRKSNAMKTDALSIGQKLIIPKKKIAANIENNPNVNTVSAEKNKVAETVTKTAEAKSEGIEQNTNTASSLPSKPGMAVYKVRQGDSLWRVAQIYGSSVEEIAKLNGLSKDSKLTPGKEIFVPNEKRQK